MKHTVIILATIFIALAFWGCGEEDEKKVDIITETLGQPVDDAPGIEEALVDEIQEDEFQAIEDAVPSEYETTELINDEYIPKIYTTGKYVLQVGVSPSQAIAKRLAKKIENKGFNAYISSVENPADLIGTFYRVRVGYFRSITEARLFGHNILMPMNIAFWIDNKANDDVGNPGKKADEYEAVEEDLDGEDFVEEGLVEEYVAPAPVAPKAEVVEPAQEVETVTPTTPAPVAPVDDQKTKAEDDWASDDDDWANEDNFN